MGGSGLCLSASSNVRHSDVVFDWRNSKLTAMSFPQMGDSNPLLESERTFVSIEFGISKWDPNYFQIQRSEL